MSTFPAPVGPPVQRMDLLTTGTMKGLNGLVWVGRVLHNLATVHLAEPLPPWRPDRAAADSAGVHGLDHLS